MKKIAAVTPKAFVPRAFQILQTSYEDALGSLPQHPHDVRIRELVARRIISLAEHGETNPDRLRDGAVASVRSMIRYRGEEAL